MRVVVPRLPALSTTVRLTVWLPVLVNLCAIVRFVVVSRSVESPKFQMYCTMVFRLPNPEPEP